MVHKSDKFARFFVVMGDCDKAPDMLLIRYRPIDPYDEVEFDDAFIIYELSDPLFTDEKIAIIDSGYLYSKLEFSNSTN
jgi:hypothetical protein